MKKYTEQAKLSVVEDYCSGSAGHRELAFLLMDVATWSGFQFAMAFAPSYFRCRSFCSGALSNPISPMLITQQAVGRRGGTGA
ncbi:hypothetical protein PMI22_00721 [Pseudomonas sp. GM21]|nr:hypothetical protein PMI22_00721 [Pseudomonas sp. GM21]